MHGSVQRDMLADDVGRFVADCIDDLLRELFPDNPAHAWKIERSLIDIYGKPDAQSGKFHGYGGIRNIMIKAYTEELRHYAFDEDEDEDEDEACEES